MNYAEVEPMFSLQQFLVTALVIMILARLITEIVIHVKNKQQKSLQDDATSYKHNQTTNDYYSTNKRAN